ncbi:MAG TPA: hypothetical protein VFF73_34065 [Planctomycetota bacterium]|nr:hypothetical protein [Planctomycetota bacterium]
MTDERDWFPLIPDRKWAYVQRGAIAAVERTVEARGPRKLGDVETFLVDRGKVKIDYSVADEGVRIHRTESEWGVEEYDPPELILKFGSKKGERWSARTASFENKGVEPVQVPAGRLEALRVVRSWTMEMPPAKCELHRWFAKNVGIVREDTVMNGTVTNVFELARIPEGASVTLLPPAASTPARAPQGAGDPQGCIVGLAFLVAGLVP